MGVRYVRVARGLRPIAAVLLALGLLSAARAHCGPLVLAAGMAALFATTLPLMRFRGRAADPRVAVGRERASAVLWLAALAFLLINALSNP